MGDADLDKVIVLPVKGNKPENGPLSLEDRDDDALMLMARAGIDRAFEVLVKRHQRMALGIAIKYLGDRPAAEDIAQNTFVDLFRSLTSYRPEGKFRAFLAAIVINNCRMAKRSEAAMRQGLYALTEETKPVEAGEAALRRRE
jgi:DNA-directed RNA polymerase specialized sigma24 family protein